MRTDGYYHNLEYLEAVINQLFAFKDCLKQDLTDLLDFILLHDANLVVYVHVCVCV